jgi:hypothetical protein
MSRADNWRKGDNARMQTLIVPGVQKCGTSTLYFLLGSHPQILASKRTETDYFNIDGNTDPQHYSKFFEGEVRDWRLDVSPEYFTSPIAPRQIASTAPDARFVFVFRDPVARAWSAWKMQLTKGSDLEPFAKSVRTQATYLEHGRYAKHLRRFLKHFAKKDMLFLRTEDLNKSLDEVLPRISRFLSIEPFPNVSQDRRNVGGLPRSMAVSRMLNLAFRMRNAVRESPLRGLVAHPAIDRASRRVRNRIATWNRAEAPDPGPDPETAQFIRSELRSEIEDLAFLTGLDLSRRLEVRT